MKMTDGEIEEIPMLSYSRYQVSNERTNVEPQRITPRARSASLSIPMSSLDLPVRENQLVSHTGPLRSERKSPITQTSVPLYISQKSDKFVWPMLAPEGRTSSTFNIEQYPSSDGPNQTSWPDDNLAGRNGHLLRSGPLGMCNDPYCTTCPMYYNLEPTQSSSRFGQKFQNIFSGNTEGWTRRCFSFLGSCLPGIMNPHAKFFQQWNKIFVISCLVAIFVDPLFFFLFSIRKGEKCIVIDWTMATTIAIVRTIIDFIYFCHMLLQFRLAYVAPESRVVGAGELVDQPKKIALHYLYGYFFIDFFLVLPLPQMMVLFVLTSYPARYAKNLIRATILVQYFPRICRFLSLLLGHSSSGFIFETASANIVFNFFISALAGHVVGSCWYLFGLQRVNRCLRNACDASNLKGCKKFVDCERENKFGNLLSDPEWSVWLNDSRSNNCLEKQGNFSYGIYQQAVELTTIPSVITRYIYSFFWGFQQISTLAGNQVPSYYVYEVLFTACIVALGVFLLALVVGNMLNFLQALSRRKLEMQLRHHDVDRWMHHRRLPNRLRRQVQQSERFYWAATHGVNEELILENLPEDLQLEIRRHLFSFIKKVRMFSSMEDPIVDAICQRLRQKLYIKGRKILYNQGVVDKIFFIVRGSVMSDDADGNRAPLSEGDFCGEELLSWCLDHSPVKRDGRKIRVTGQHLLSNRTVTCLTNVEAFSLSATDLEEVAALFPKFLRRLQNAIRRESPYWRAFAVLSIQVAWRYRKKRLSPVEASSRESRGLRM